MSARAVVLSEARFEPFLMPRMARRSRFARRSADFYHASPLKQDRSTHRVPLGPEHVHVRVVFSATAFRTEDGRAGHAEDAAPQTCLPLPLLDAG